ncbi:hypothetical protein [Saccharomonospora sp. NB11]|uniref:hypothetical protein n=1 Tax=Saccharomonospora sp. NB11 TaxID=1642298 RepID=UPI0018D078C3|nr:hypothetical protein [Saccharomonospora sp. NB11]
MVDSVGCGSAAELAEVVEYLDKLAVDLRSSPRRGEAEVSAASDALACAAALLRTQGAEVAAGASRLDLVREAIALARSTLETAKYAARERFGTHRLDADENS